MEEFLGQYPVLLKILSAIGTIVVLATSYVFISPSKKDDEKLDELLKKPLAKKIHDFFIKFSVISKK
ncbi:MAG: hypothetical protein Unbinned5081contig1003_13 [Prokaryotic dsDNA virus sp.]|nr:MAG: hypothetical protein Unbinned5081contig1003_13 [Prokaryotic dsDNA virus sp.]|tara:strand:- start:9702 stop:9902 length:201 start_codon:yes stop_codon:yes gene_type:complete